MRCKVLEEWISFWKWIIGGLWPVLTGTVFYSVKLIENGLTTPIKEVIFLLSLAVIVFLSTFIGFAIKELVSSLEELKDCKED